MTTRHLSLPLPPPASRRNHSLLAPATRSLALSSAENPMYLYLNTPGPFSTTPRARLLCAMMWHKVYYRGHRKTLFVCGPLSVRGPQPVCGPLPVRGPLPVCGVEQCNLRPFSARHELCECDPTAVRRGRHRTDHPH